MAFSTSNVQKNVFGSLKVTCGDWTGSQADASGTLAVEGGRIWFAQFSIQDPISPTQQVPWEAAAPSGSTTTITVHNRATVARGRFMVIHS